MSNTQDKIKICSDHQDKEETPLIWTFAFMGAEYWCPFCGDTRGMLGAGENVPTTKRLKDRLANYKKLSSQYLRGNALLICASTKYKGEWIKPSELPPKSKAFWKKKSEEWEYGI